MSLQGTFDTLSVTELFGLLSTAGKTGALRLEAGHHEASLLVRAGRCCAVDDGAPVALGTESELGARLVDVGFTLARQPEGSFRFSDGDVAESGVSVAFDPAVAEITAMVEAWKDIETTIPSLDVRLRLAPALGAEEIVLGAPEWALLVGLQGRPTVRELVATAGESLLDVCRRVKDLVDRGAVEVGTAAPTPAAPVPVAEPAVRVVAAEPPPQPEPQPRPQPEPRPPTRDRAALEEATTHLLDPIEPYAPEADEPADRSALLRLFSALKE
ncbi:MAG TPA: DUF4388 domain-containing protein [Acidimicrobiia bacterium]|nr:DUF4388 domain-containing protein [Acidimicrobiia bacterium]